MTLEYKCNNMNIYNWNLHDDKSHYALDGCVHTFRTVEPPFVPGNFQAPSSDGHGSVYWFTRARTDYADWSKWKRVTVVSCDGQE